MGQPIEVRVTDLRKTVKDAEMRKVQLETKLESAKERLSDAENECRTTHKIEPDELDANITSLEKKMNTLAASIEEMLPSEEAKQTVAF